VRVTTLGKKGAVVERSGHPIVQVACPQEERKADPTGVGDAFRAGFLAGIGWRLSDERCAQIGAMLATFVIETVGTQEYDLGHGQFLDRFTEAYGADATADILRHLHVIPA